MARRILLLLTDLQIGGTPTVVRELATRLNDPPEVEIGVACLASWGPVAEQLRGRGISVTALGAPGPMDVAVVWRLVKLIRAQDYDTVFSFLVHANAVAAAASLFCRKARFLQSIQTTQPRPRWHWFVQGAAQHAAQRIIVPSPSAAAAARDWAMIPAEKIQVIANAIDIEPLRQREFDPAAIRIGFLGRLDPVKRVQDLIDAMRDLDARFTLHIFGSGPEERFLKQWASQVAPERIVFHGAVAKAQQAMQRIDILVLPSEAEGFGLVLIEAMAAGIPVVASDVAGIRDVIMDGLTGLLAPVASPRKLAQAIQLIADDPALRGRLVQNAWQDVARRFNWPGVIQQYRKLLQLPTTNQEKSSPPMGHR